MKLIKVWRCCYTNCAGESHTSAYVFDHDTAKAWLEASEAHEAKQDHRYRIRHFITEKTVIYCPKENLVIPIDRVWPMPEGSEKPVEENHERT